MSDKPHALRAEDLRFAYLLLGECCELGADPLVWRRHFLQQLSVRFGAVASVDIAASMQPDAEGRPTPRVEASITFDHYSAKERSLLTRCLKEMRMEDNALGKALIGQAFRKGAIAGTRRDWTSNRDWERCGFFTDYGLPLGWYESMVGLALTSNGLCCFNFVRPQGEPCFPKRDARLLELLIQEISALPATRLAPMSGTSVLQLPMRMRQILARIVHGDSEKQTALALGIGRSTVHEYVRRLYRRFGVASRGELMARLARQLYALDLLNEKSADDVWYFQQSA